MYNIINILSITLYHCDYYKYKEILIYIKSKWIKINNKIPIHSPCFSQIKVIHF